MKIEKVLAGTGLIAIGFFAGGIFGRIQDIKLVLDILEETMPGFKKAVVNGAAHGAGGHIAEHLFKKPYKIDEEES